MRENIYIARKKSEKSGSIYICRWCCWTKCPSESSVSQHYFRFSKERKSEISRNTRLKRIYEIKKTKVQCCKFNEPKEKSIRSDIVNWTLCLSHRINSYQHINILGLNIWSKHVSSSDISACELSTSFPLISFKCKRVSAACLNWSNWHWKFCCFFRLQETTWERERRRGKKERKKREIRSRIEYRWVDHPTSSVKCGAHVGTYNFDGRFSSALCCMRRERYLSSWKLEHK